MPDPISIVQANTQVVPLWRFLLSMPFIYGLIVPVVVLDLSIELYHQICFRLYGIPLVSRRRYIRIDRHRLKYLTFMGKLHCVYCGYVNGLFHYISVIAAATELYWCPIKHHTSPGQAGSAAAGAKDENFRAPRHHDKFAAYGDIQDLKRVLATKRTDLELPQE